MGQSATADPAGIAHASVCPDRRSQSDLRTFNTWRLPGDRKHIRVSARETEALASDPAVPAGPTLK